MPTEEPRMTPPEVGSELQEARQAVLHMDATWNVHGRKRTYLYAYHPGMQLRITTPQQELEAYSRRMVGETGEVIMDYRDKTGDFSRHTFVSREDCVVTQYLAGGKETLPELILSIDPPETLPKFGVKKWGTGPEVNMKYELVYDKAGTYLGQAAHYPVFVESELQDKGYVTMVRILHTGGSRNVEQTEGSKEIHIRGAKAVWILAKTAAQVEMGEMEDFPGVKAQETIDAVLADLKSAVAKYRTKEGSWNYERALALQKEQQRGTYGTVSFHLGEQTADSGEEGIEQYGTVTAAEKYAADVAETDGTDLPDRQICAGCLRRIFCTEAVRTVDRGMESRLERSLYDGCQCEYSGLWYEYRAHGKSGLGIYVFYPPPDRGLEGECKSCLRHVGCPAGTGEYRR